MSKEVEKLAEDGDAESQCSVAFLYEIGLDRPIDLDKALEWWKKAAAQGHQIAIDKVASYANETELETNPTPESQQAEHTPTALRSKLLLVEDESDLREILTLELEDNNFKVIPVDNGEEALQALMKTPDITAIITDLKMPKMNGIQFIKTMRKMKLGERAALIVMTSYSKPELIETGRKMKVDHWLAKPFELSKLVEAVKTVTAKRSKVA